MPEVNPAAHYLADQKQARAAAPQPRGHLGITIPWRDPPHPCPWNTS